MEGALEHSEATLLDRLNYFNYLTEVEDEFVRLRGSHMLISPLDWAVVESWKDAGIPLHIVLRGISRAFEAYHARRHGFQKVNSILYCQQEVQASFEEYRVSQVGAGGERSASPDGPDADRSQSAGDTRKQIKHTSSFTKEVLLEFIARCLNELARAADGFSPPASIDAEADAEAEPGGPFCSAAAPREALEAIGRGRARLEEINDALSATGQVDPEALERDLDSIDNMLLESLRKAYGAPQIEKLRDEAKAHLRAYRKKMEAAIYEQTIENFVARRLRELGRLPRLSLFYV